METNNQRVYYELTEEQIKRIYILKALLAIFAVYIHIGVGVVQSGHDGIETVFPNWFVYCSYLLSEVIPRSAVPGFFFYLLFCCIEGSLVG